MHGTAYHHSHTFTLYVTRTVAFNLKLTRSSAVAEGLRNMLVSRNNANYYSSHLKKIAITK